MKTTTLNLSGMKYLWGFTTPLIILLTLLSSGPLAYTTPFYIFFIIPLLDALLPIKPESLTPEDELRIQNQVFYDILLYIMCVCQYLFFGLFLFQVQKTQDLFTL